MTKLFSLFAALVISMSAAAQGFFRPTHKTMPRLNPTTVTVPQHKASPKKAGSHVLPINAAETVVLYTNVAYSQPGHNDYYFFFSNADDENGIPTVMFDLYLPTEQGLEAGTYSMADGSVDNIMLVTSYEDYVSYYYGYQVYDWASATVSLVKAEGEADDWTVNFSATTTSDDTYTFSFAGTLPVESDDYDPNEDGEGEGGEGGGGTTEETSYKYEPTEVTQMDIIFNETWASDRYVADYGLYDIVLKSDQTDAKGRRYEAELYLATGEKTPHADFYPVNTSGAYNTFVASIGCSLTSNSKDYPCFLRTFDDRYVYDTWYIVAGYIVLGYDAAGEMMLEGNVASYNGSEIHFCTENASGINTVLAPQQTSVKVLRDNRIYINDGAAQYNVSGQRLR